MVILNFVGGSYNHDHAHPYGARHGLRWFEFDITWQNNKLLRSLGWAKRIRKAQYTV